MTYQKHRLAHRSCSLNRAGYGAAIALGALGMSAIFAPSAIAAPVEGLPSVIVLDTSSQTAEFYSTPEAALAAGESLEKLEATDTPVLLTQSDGRLADDASNFGDRGQTRWFIQAGAGTEGDGESLGLIGGGVSYFFAKGHSLNLALNGMAFDLPDKDPVGVNLDLLVRSHWIRGENWSLYIDGGAGILVSTSRVPNGGSSFNFTPQGGLGASINVNKEKDQRLLLGVRWHHISNANTFEANPGLDTYMGYVGMTFPIQ